MKRRVLTPFAAFVLVVCVVVLGTSSPVGATSCAGYPSVSEQVSERLSQGPVFVGTVVSTRNGGTWGTIAVEEVWSGDVADEVEVKAGPERTNGKFQSMGGEQTFVPGARYLVTATRVGDVVPGWPTFGAPGELEMSVCVPLLDWNETLVAERPADARVVERTVPIEVLGALYDVSPGDGSPWPFIGAISIFVLIVGVGGLLAWRFGRKADEPVDDSEIEDLIDVDRHRAGLD